MAVGETKEAVEIGKTAWEFGWLAFVIAGGFLGAYIQRLRSGTGEGRPIYWNLILFAIIGAIFSLQAMEMVAQDHRDGIALLFLGLIGGYAASIKELDLAKHEIEKLKLEADSKRNNLTGNGQSNEAINSNKESST